ncbi:MAG: cysteine desulfurase [Clostridia bacterium]|nr:cysteine desulfurase [Clostridia bacterium]
MDIYLDNSATTKVCREAVDAMLPVLTDNFGNPSAVHARGVRAKTALETARGRIANVLSCAPEEVYFSHSGTLANNTAIFGAAEMKKRAGNRIVTTALEHPSVANCMARLEERGFEVIRLKPAAGGAFAPEDLLRAVNKNTILISCMLVNNETGAVNPVELLQKAARRAGAPALIHVDAIQAFGKMPVKPGKLGADLLTISGHKIHGPKGVGALYVRKGVQIRPYVVGGGQENGLFSGTEPLPAIVGFGAAAAALPDVNRTLERMHELRRYAAEQLKALPAVAINSPADGLPYIINLSVAGIPSQVLINYLSERGIYVSAGSACKKGHRSEVLSVMGLPPARIDSAIRVSMSRYTTREELDALVGEIRNATKNIRTKL